MRRDLHIIALYIFNLCAANNMDLKIQWIPRSELEKADFISKIIDIDDWQISHGLFRFLDNSWGYTVDIQWIVLLITIIASYLSFSLATGIQDARE